MKQILNRLHKRNNCFRIVISSKIKSTHGTLSSEVRGSREGWGVGRGGEGWGGLGRAERSRCGGGQPSSRCGGTSPRSRSRRPCRSPSRRDTTRGCRGRQGYLRQKYFINNNYLTNPHSNIN